MVRFENSHHTLSLEEIGQFEKKTNIVLPAKYKKFLLRWNGGNPEPSLFDITNDQGTSVLNVFNGIGEMYDNLEEAIDIYEFRIPDGFIPIADDPAGNVICLGTKSPYKEYICFWDHEQEQEDPNNMNNMYFLSSDIDEFLDSLYDE